MTQAAARSSQPTAVGAATIPQASRVTIASNQELYNSQRLFGSLVLHVLWEHLIRNSGAGGVRLLPVTGSATPRTSPSVAPCFPPPSRRTPPALLPDPPHNLAPVQAPLQPKRPIRLTAPHLVVLMYSDALMCLMHSGALMCLMVLMYSDVLMS